MGGPIYGHDHGPHRPSRSCGPSRSAGRVARHARTSQSGVAVRRGRPDGFGNVRASVYDGVEAIELSPLTLAASRNALVAAGFSGADADRWALRCGGLPLAVAEVARLASFASPTPSDVAAVLPAAYLERIAALPAEVADAALCVAVCGDLGVLRVLGIPRLFRRSSSAGCVPWLDSSRRRWVAWTRPGTSLRLRSRSLPLRGVPVVTAIANAALGHLELSLGNDQAALALLDKMADLTDRMNLREPEYSSGRAITSRRWYGSTRSPTESPN